MTKRVYKSAQGKSVDLGALLLKNEGVRAVGNNPVNAGGDMIDSTNRSIQKRTHQVNNQYRKQVQTNVSDEPVVSSRKKVKEQAVETKNQTAPVIEPVQLPDQIETKPAEKVETVSAQESDKTESKDEGTTGLAAAIAKARSVKQESLKTPAQIAKSTSGVKKI